ncbi:hypothetical protein ACFJGW_02510 [Burkholderiaceae bacterium UC74_6]
MNEFLSKLREQRWDDHRYYHHCRINQSLHLLSALSFLCAYALLFKDPALAALLAWLVSMTSRQAGHFFFEPRGYDHINQATDEHKEAIKVGYNIQRKIVLMSLWAGLPLLLWLQPSMFGLIEPATNFNEFWHQLGYAWLALGVGGLLFRMGQLLIRDGWLESLSWGTKIVTDPFHDAWLYHRAPLQLLKGERFEAGHEPRPA